MVTPVRGEVWTIAGGGRISSKPRPAVIMTSELFSSLDHLTVALITTNRAESPVRITVEPAATTGLVETSYIMADKLHTIARSNLGHRCGTITSAHLLDLERAILVYLGIAGR